MKLRKMLLFFVFVLFIIGAANSQVADKQYADTYGTGTVIASGKGLPLKNKFDKSQVEFKNGIFYVIGGEGATISIRALLKDGKTFKYYLDSLRKNYSP